MSRIGKLSWLLLEVDCGMLRGREMGLLYATMYCFITKSCLAIGQLLLDDNDDIEGYACQVYARMPTLRHGCGHTPARAA
jgi:hypothetical protein